MRRTMLFAVACLFAASCGSADVVVVTDGGSAPESSTTSAPDPTVSGVDDPSVDDPGVDDPAGEVPIIEVTALFDGDGPREASVAGFVIRDDASARLCETIMESFPPQCGGMWVVIADPENLTVAFDEANGVRWTPNRVAIAATFDGDRLVIDGADSSEPTDADHALIDSFLAFVADPNPTTAAGLPFAGEVALGLGAEIVITRGSDELSDSGAWRLDRDEFRAWAGPFSALDVVAEPLAITVGAHARCAAQPEPAPAGFGDHRRISVQPTDATSCLEWWTVDVFVDANGDIAAVTLDLFAP